MFKIFIILLLLFLITGCAASYSEISLDSTKYSKIHDIQSLKIEYSYDVLQQNGNDKYSELEEEASIDIVSFKIKNDSSADIILTKDNFKIYKNNRAIDILDPNIAAEILQQNSTKYLTWFFANLWMTKTDESGERKVTFIPFGLPIGIYNMIKANNSNKDLANDINKHFLLGKPIKAGDTAHGILPLRRSNKYPLTFEFLKGE